MLKFFGSSTPAPRGHRLLVYWLGWVLFSGAVPTFAQEEQATAAHSSSGSSEVVYHSDIDNLLSVEKISIMPFTDNLQGIYARPLEAHFISLVEKMHRWDYLPANGSGPILAPEELETAPEKAKQVTQGLGVDGFFVCRVTKGPNGVTIHLSLFLTGDGKLLSQAVLKDYGQFDLNSLKEQLERLLSEIVVRLPYSGRILSRDGNRVTVNLGQKDGIQAGQILSVIQIIQAQRHPKFNFLIKTEKEIIGRVRILKVDETLSFATVVTEREKGAVQKNNKIGALDFVNYSGGESLSNTPSAEEALGEKDDGRLVFGKNAHAWRPQDPPTIGQVGARFGLSRFNGNAQQSDGSTLQGNNYFAPSIQVDGELWVTPEWTFYGAIKQGILPISNPVNGGQPSQLNQSLSFYEAGLGYTVRLGPHVWSARIEPFLGYFSYQLYADSSNPQAFATSQYGGFKIGVLGSAPLTPGGDYGAGGTFSMAVNPNLSESPVTSGSGSKSSVINFGLLGYKKLSERMRLQVNLDFAMYSSTFSGQGTRTIPLSSSSQRYTDFSGGIYYMF